MRWLMTISETNPKISVVSVTVEANNWITAFEAGLKMHPAGSGLTGDLRCVVVPDNILQINDILRQKTYQLQPLDTRGNTQPQTLSTWATGHERASSMPPLTKAVTIGDNTVSAFEKMQEITALKTHQQVAEFGLSLAMEFIPCRTGCCMLRAAAKQELSLAASKGLQADLFPPQPIDINRGIVGFAIRQGAVVMVSRPENSPLLAADYHVPTTYKTENILCAPLQFEGRTAGAILLLNSLKETGFSQSDTNTLSYLGGALAEYMEKSLAPRPADF